MNSYRLIPAIALSGLVALSVACGSTGNSTPKPATTQAANAVNSQATQAAKAADSKGELDPCQILGQADAAKAMGEAASDGKLSRGGEPLGQVLCSYSAVAPASFSSVQLSVVRTQDMTSQLRGNGYSARKLFDDSKALFATRQAIDGIGDEAYVTGKQLKAVQGNTEFSLMMGLGADADPATTAKLTDLARTIAPRLPR